MQLNIAIIAETAPARTLIPIIERLDDANITSLTHGEGASDIHSLYSDEVIQIGKSRRNTNKKRSNALIATLVMKDTYKTYRELKKRDIDFVLTCGNSGDVRKGIIAAKKLKIPNIHIEQDIYNPIEVISYADIITTPTHYAQKKLKKLYNITNTVNIKGYPQAAYVNEVQLINKHEIYQHYGTNNFYVLVLGGDAQAADIPKIMHQVGKLARDVIVIPYRFNAQYVSQFIKDDNILVVDGFVDLLSLMNASCGVIYIAGMGITIEVGVLETPAVKIQGFHDEHQSNHLAESLGIEIAAIEDIPLAVSRMKKPNGRLLVRNGINASWRVVDLINNFKVFKKEKGGYSSLKNIWNQRKKYR